MNWLKIFATFLIFIVILGGIDVVYELFFQDSPQKSIEENSKVKTKEIVTQYSADLKPNLSDIEYIRQDNLKPYQIKTKPKKEVKIKEHEVKVLTIKDLKQKLNTRKATIKNKKNIYNKDQKRVFQTLKTLLIRASQRDISSQNIVLNSSISSILRSKRERDEFLELISQNFGISIEVVEELSYTNGYLWDWIRELSN